MFPVGHTVHLRIHKLNDEEFLEKDEQKYNKILTMNKFSDLKYFLAADNELDEASSVSANICDTVCERLFCNAKCTAIRGFHLHSTVHMSALDKSQFAKYMQSGNH